MDTLDLIRLGIHPTQAKQFAPVLDPAMQRFGIASVDQRAGFLAQAMHESNDFKHLEEDLFYRRAPRVMEMWPTRFVSIDAVDAVLGKPELLANTVYSNRNGNGDFASGDGWRFRGRGLFQLTFRDNYRLASQELGINYLEQPELVAQPEGAALTAAWFWHTRGCNELMARGEFDRTTRKINPGLAGFNERHNRYAAVKALLEGATA